VKLGVLILHTFDIAHTRFADRHVAQPASADLVTREAYSREVISFGFWFGDDRLAEPALYAYTAPEPRGLADAPLQPAAAWWDRATAPIWPCCAMTTPAPPTIPGHRAGLL
jgi:hypothetical protein